MTLKHIVKNKLKTYFIAGLLVVGPIGLTVIVVQKGVGWLDGLLYSALPPALHPDNLIGQTIPGLGFVAGLLLILLVGVIAANVMGRYFVNLFERLLYRIPLIKSIYTLFKQVADTTIGKERKGFS